MSLVFGSIGLLLGVLLGIFVFYLLSKRRLADLENERKKICWAFFSVLFFNVFRLCLFGLVV